MTPRYLWSFLALLLAGVLARALRFWILLGRVIPMQLLALIVMVRNLFVDLLPARLGEFSYVYLVTTRGRVPAEHGLATLLLAVLFDIVAIAPLLILAVLVVRDGGAVSAPALAAAAVGLGVLAFGMVRTAVPVGGWVARHLGSDRGDDLRSRLARLAHRTVDALEEVRDRGVFVQVLLVSMVVRLCKFGSYYFLVLAIMTPLGYSVSGLGFFRVFLGVVSAELAAALPIHGIAGFGTFEAAWALSFSQLGFTTEHAIMSGILAHVVSQAVEYSLGAAALLYVIRPVARTP